MQVHQAGVRIDLQDRVSRREMIGRFEQPACRRIAGLKGLQDALVMLVSRQVFDAVEPLREGGDIEHPGERLRIETLHQQRSTFFRTVKVELVDVLQLRRQMALKVHQQLPGPSSRILLGASHARGGDLGDRGFPVAQVAVCRVAREEVEQEGGTAAREPQDDERLLSAGA